MCGNVRYRITRPTEFEAGRKRLKGRAFEFSGRRIVVLARESRLSALGGLHHAPDRLRDLRTTLRGRLNLVRVMFRTIADHSQIQNRPSRPRRSPATLDGWVI